MTQIDILDVTHDGFAGHVSPETAYETLQHVDAAKIIDVRTRPEWAFVGLPVVAENQLACVEWLVFPEMKPNTGFVDLVSQQYPETETVLFMLCRSGARSMAAAQAMTAAGYSAVYNIAGGFEGDLDALGHRGTVNGWKQAGLPWGQQ